MNSKRVSFMPQDSMYPFMGLNTLDPSTLSDPRYSPYCMNVYSNKGIVEKRFGSNILGKGSDFPDKLLGFISYKDDTLERYIAITSKYQYYYNEGTDSWEECYNEILEDGLGVWSCESGVTQTTMEGIAHFYANGLTTGDLISKDVNAQALNINSLAIDFYYIMNLTNLKVTVNTTEFDISDQLPSLGDYNPFRVHINLDSFTDDTISTIKFSTTDTLVEKYFGITSIKTICAWSGSENVWIDSTDGMDDNGQYVFITNGVDKMLVYGKIEGGTHKMFFYNPPADSNLSNLDSCKTVCMFLGALVIGNIVLDGLYFENSIAISKPGDFWDFNAITADIVLLDSVKGGIEKVMPYMESLVVYGKYSFTVVRFMSGEISYIFDQIISGETILLSGRGVVNLGAYHAVMLQDNIYLFNGTKQLIPIGNAICRTYVDSLELEKADLAFAFNNFYSKEAYFVVPVTKSEETDPGVRVFVLKYNDYTLENMTWTLYEYFDDITCFGFYQENRTYTFDSVWAATTKIEDANVSFSDLRASPGFPQMVLGQEDQALIIDRTVSSDSGESVSCEWQSIDFTVPEYYETLLGRWIQLEVEIEGLDASLEYSINRGETWHTIADLDYIGSRTTLKFPIDVISKHCRFRIKSNTSFKMYWLRVWINKGGRS